MKRTFKAAAWLGLMVLIVLMPFCAASLTAQRRNYVREHYESWSGVLRLWKCDGWAAGNGSLNGWLNLCIERFEKRYPGVYVQLTDVPAETLRSYVSANVNPPDLILYAPGMLDAPYSLLQMEGDFPLRTSLQTVGLWQEARYAVPVALGGYAMAINSQLLGDTSGRWSELRLTEKKSTKVQKDIHLLNAPADGSFTSWSASLISMFAGGCEVKQSEPVGEGIDLGLPAGAPVETISPGAEETELPSNALPVVLPAGFRKAESVYAQFVNGEIAAMPVTQREIRRLSQLSESGKAPDWRAETMGLPFTDQIALASVVAYDREDARQRQELSTQLIHLMLSEEMQSKITASRAFPVIELPSLYQNQIGMREIEKALSGGSLITPPVFGGEWRAYAAELLNGIGAGGETEEACERLKSLFSEK